MRLTKHRGNMVTVSGDVCVVGTVVQGSQAYSLEIVCG